MGMNILSPTDDRKTSIMRYTDLSNLIFMIDHCHCKMLILVMVHMVTFTNKYLTINVGCFPN